jgi:glycosyltransferase involved in cell wall biosynthesis
VLTHEHDALLFDPAEADGFWRAVERLAADPALRARLGVAARRTVLERDLTWDGNARRVVAIAERELARREAAPA